MSVLVMVLALATIRFNGNEFAIVPEGDTQQARVVAVNQTEPDEDALRGALTEAFTADGRLVDLIVDDVRIGNGSEAGVGDTVSVHYIGTTQAGVKFDSSYDRNEPFTFNLGEGKVIEGWERGLIGMKVGGERILVIPSDMAYGNRHVGPIAPNSVLVFSIELLSVTE